MKDSDPILDWHLNDAMPGAVEALGMLPALITPASADSIWYQLTHNSPHGFETAPPIPKKWELLDNDYLYYPGLPAMEPYAMAWLRDEKILVYSGGFICIVHADNRFTVGRLK